MSQTLLIIRNDVWCLGYQKLISLILGSSIPFHKSLADRQTEGIPRSNELIVLELVVSLFFAQSNWRRKRRRSRFAFDELWHKWQQWMMPSVTVKKLICSCKFACRLSMLFTVHNPNWTADQANSSSISSFIDHCWR